MLSIAICDRDALLCTYLDQKIKDYFYYYGIDVKTNCFFDELVLRQYYFHEKYDYIFLEIYIMPDEGGIETVKLIQEQNEDTKIIFVTNYTEIIFDALRLSAYYFIRKSHFEHDLDIALLKIKQNFTKKSKYYFFNLKNAIEKVLISDIIYLESFKHDITVHCKNKKLVITNNTLSRLYEQLKPHDFIQIHKSYIVNLFFITSINKTDVTLNDNFVLQVSRHRKALLCQSFDNYIRKLGWLK